MSLNGSTALTTPFVRNKNWKMSVTATELVIEGK